MRKGLKRMVGAGMIALALAVVGYAMQGWVFAIGGAVVFLVLLPPLNYALIFGMNRFEQVNTTAAFQAVKWLLAAAVLASMYILAG